MYLQNLSLFVINSFSSMDEKKYKQQNNNNNLCWILDDKIRDVVPLIIIKLELNDIKNIRLVCRKFQSLIDNNCDKLFNLIFRLTMSENMKKQELEEIIIKNPIITSFFFMNTFNCQINEDLIECISNYVKELKLLNRNFWFDNYELKGCRSLESLSIEDSNLSLKCWNSIPSSLSYLILHNTRFFDENENYIFIEEFPLNLKKLNITYMNLTNFKTWPQKLVRLELSYSIISSDDILNLSKLPTLSYLTLLGIREITEIDLSNFNFLKFLTYNPVIKQEHIYFKPEDDNQHIYFPSSLETLILNFCMNENVKSTKLPNSLINLEINEPYSNFISFLLKEENKLPLLQSFSINCEGFEIEDIPKIFHQYDRLKLLIFSSIDWNITNEKIDKMFSYIPPNLSELQIHECPLEYNDYIINLFPANCLKQCKNCSVHSGYNSLFFSFIKK